MITLVVDDPGDCVLLGRRPTWPVGRFSALAGFVEPREALEAAVAREVGEEAGGEAHVADHDLESVRWFTRGELSAAARADVAWSSGATPEPAADADACCCRRAW